MEYKMFTKPCLECGKEVIVNNPDEMAFCNKVCQTNYFYKKSRYSFRDSNWKKVREKDEEEDIVRV